MKTRVYTTLALLLGLLLVINLLSNEFHFRLDLTEDRQYTLSRATRDILDNLDEPVTVTAYFSKDLPPHIAKTKRDFQDMLLEYAMRSGNMVQYKFVNPNEKESLETEAVNNGIQPVLINVREKDQIKQQKAFLGAVVSLGEKQEILPFIQPGAAMEYALSTAIKKLSVENKPVIGFLQGHGEATKAELRQLYNQLEILYTPQEVRLDSMDVPLNVKTLVVIRPNDSIPPAQLERIEQFLSRGGRLLLALNRVQGDLQQSMGYAIGTGWEDWLQKRGITLEDAFVIDVRSGSVTVQQQTAFGMLQTQLPFYYLPIAAVFAKHPVTTGLENVMFEFVSPIQIKTDSAIKHTPLVFSSERSNSLKAPQFFDINRQWTEADFPQRNLVLAAAFEGAFAGDAPSRMVVIADGDFVLTGNQRKPPDNINLVANAIDWLSDDTGLVSLRTKGVTSRPLDELSDGSKAAIKYANFVLPLLLAIGYGLYRYQQNRIIRMKRMSDLYE
ncbi:MAG: GldG family protein [Cyclobacteriaceae bacterium]|nr:GldG family protein [Cyclobacteriaceae bacterium]MDW8332352.1 GldG family protein [Cyclobacteriaceae bacterium]